MRGTAPAASSYGAGGAVRSCYMTAQIALRKVRIPSWRVFRQWGMTKAYLGVVEAPDKVSALQRAIRMFHVLSPDHQKHLVVEPRTL
jgi:hypothetical protein